MFDTRTSELLREAPSFPALNSEILPELLTHHYARFVSIRLSGGDNGEYENLEESWSLERIADAYETITSIEEDPLLRRAAAFVAGTARLLISKGKLYRVDEERYVPIDRDSVDAPTAAAVLFLAAEQYADAYEAVSLIPSSKGPHEIRVLSDHIKDLASGRLNGILSRASVWRHRVKHENNTLSDRALCALATTIIEGIELLADRELFIWREQVVLSCCLPLIFTVMIR